MFACGHRREGPGVAAADEFFSVDIVDVDAVGDLCQRLGVDLVYSVGSDLAMPTVARVSERLGLPYFHDVATTDLLHDKVLLRQFLAEHHLSPVAHRAVDSADDLIGYEDFPAVLKPTDAQGQRGITVVRDGSEAERALQAALDASTTRRAVIEEWLDGPEISVHLFVVDGEIRFFVPSDRYVWDGPLVGIPQGHGLPCRALDRTARGQVEELLGAVVRALGVDTGPLYAQLKLTSDRGPRVIEIASRLDGCHLWRLIETHTGLNLLDACFDLLAGGAWKDPEPWSDDPGHTLWFELADPSVPVDLAAHRPPPDQRVVYEELQVGDGERPRDTNGVIARVGYRIVEDR